MTSLTVSGKTIEEAVKKAASRFNTTTERIAYRVIQEPKKGFLGLIGSQAAIIEAELLPDPVERARHFLTDTIRMIVGETPTIYERREENIVQFDIELDSKIGRLIGKRGQTIQALEYLTNLVGNKVSDTYIKFELDAENYRERRKQTLERLALRVADRVMRTKRAVALEPMNARERKIIHTTIQSVEGVTTVSEGVGAKRHVIVLFDVNKKRDR